MIDLLLGNPLSRRLADGWLKWYSRRRTRELNALDVSKVQHQTLMQLVTKAKSTQFGQKHGFDRIASDEHYQAAVPIRTYEDFWRDFWQAAFPKLDGTTWPDFIPYYALSSGTTSGTTKYIPISHEMLASNRKAAFTTMALFRDYVRDARIFKGRIFFLGGNTDLRKESNGSRSGDLSAIASIEVAKISRPFTFPPNELAGIADWENKVARLAEASARLPITAISGVPAWILVLFDRLKKVTGKSTVADVWPQLRLVIHGGTKFEPYREVFQQELGPKVHTCEVYPASEGFIATEDPRYKLLRIVPDHGLFFEFVPIDQFTDGKLSAERPVRHTLANVEVGVQYAVAVSSCAGLWSYLIGDTITFERRDPPLIRFTGRTKYFLSAFGEHLISEELEKAIAEAAHAAHCTVAEFHVGPVFPTVPNTPGHHLYLVEFRSPASDRGRFIEVLDTELSRLNEDYEAHRKGDLSMLKPAMQIVKPGAFERWMLAHGKRPPQHKVPRMDNSGEQTKAILGWMREHGELV